MLQGVRPIVILGAGLAGLSLADALLDEDLARPIVLIDRRRAWDRDRTWCTWETEELRFSALASHRWWEWRTCRNGHEAVHSTARFPYLHIGSRAFYAAVLDRLDGDPRVEVRTGERVLAVRDGADGPEVVTERESFTAEYAVDALGPRSPLLPADPAPEASLAQRFLGWEVEIDTPSFDPGAATLMDFRPAESGALTFLYVLPFTPTRALVEHTTIGPGDATGPSSRRRRTLLESELGERLGIREWQVLHEERGEIPMTTRAHVPRRGDRVLSAGAAAGAIRPSSGYAFSRTQRHVARLAHAIATGGAAPEAIGPARLAAMDRVFLAAIRDQPDHGEALLWAVARGVGADAFARFMTDTSTLADEAQIVRALPPRTMTATALRLLVRRTASAALGRAAARRPSPPTG